MAGSVDQVLADLRDRLAYFDATFGPEGDCGESCMFVSVNDLRILIAAIPAGRREAA